MPVHTPLSTSILPEVVLVLQPRSHLLKRLDWLKTFLLHKMLIAIRQLIDDSSIKGVFGIATATTSAGLSVLGCKAKSHPVPRLILGTSLRCKGQVIGVIIWS